MKISRRSLIGTALAGAALATPVFAQSTRRWIFAWAYERGTNRIFVSSSVTEFSGGDWDAPTRRWNSALRSYDSFGKTSAVNIGTPSDIYYDNATDANDARYDFIEKMRRQGKSVEIYNW